MTKYLPHHRAFATLMRNDQVFLNEAHVYNNILPLLGDIGPRCVFADENEVVMEDLKSQDYVVQPRLDLLDFQHCTAIVEVSFHKENFFKSFFKQKKKVKNNQKHFFFAKYFPRYVLYKKIYFKTFSILEIF